MDDHFSMRLPRVVEDGTSIEVVFDSAVFRYGTRFQGRAFAVLDVAEVMVSPTVSPEPAVGFAS